MINRAPEGDFQVEDPLTKEISRLVKEFQFTDQEGKPNNEGMRYILKLMIQDEFFKNRELQEQYQGNFEKYFQTIEATVNRSTLAYNRQTFLEAYQQTYTQPLNFVQQTLLWNKYRSLFPSGSCQPFPIRDGSNHLYSQIIIVNWKLKSTLIHELRHGLEHIMYGIIIDPDGGREREKVLKNQKIRNLVAAGFFGVEVFLVAVVQLALHSEVFPLEQRQLILNQLPQLIELGKINGIPAVLSALSYMYTDVSYKKIESEERANAAMKKYTK